MHSYVPATEEDRTQLKARKEAQQERQLAALRSGSEEPAKPEPKPTPPTSPARPDVKDVVHTVEKQLASDKPTPAAVKDTTAATAALQPWKKHDPMHEIKEKRRNRSNRPTKSASSASSASSDKPDSPAEKMDFLRDYLGDCQRCPLSKGRTNVVFGVGDPEARLMFIGEGPGLEEDRQGLPFIGPSGQLLTKMIEAMGLSREEVYITNVVKCRPPEKRSPEPFEVKECAPFLKKQIQVVKPDVIVTVGRFATVTLLQVDEPLGKLRGRWHEYMETAVMPTYHPAYLLRQEENPEFKKKAWNDLQMVMKRLGLS